jgi:hypothetical protein
VPTVRSNAVLAVERTVAYSRTFAHLRTLGTRLRASTCPLQERNAVLRSNALADPAALLHLCEQTY